MSTSESNRSPLRVQFSFQANMVSSRLWTIQNTPRARAGSSVLSTIEKSARPSASVKGQRHVQFNFWTYMSAFLLRNNTELLTRARGEFCIVHNRKVGASVDLLKGPQKCQILFFELHVGFSIVDNTHLHTRARARAWGRVYCPQ